MFATQKRAAVFGSRRPPSTRDLLHDETIRLLEAGTEQKSTLSIPRPTTEAELAALVYQYLGIRIPDVSCCQGHSTPWRAFCDAYFAVNPVSVWLGARGLAGKTFLAAVLGVMKAITYRASVSILGGSADQSEKVHEYMQGFWLKPTAPQEVLASDPSKRTTHLVWLGHDGTRVKIKALAASQKQARSGHPSLLIVDEADELDWGVFTSVRGQPQVQGDIAEHMVVSSTMQYAEGTMAKVLREAEEKGWPVHRWCYRETMAPHGWLSDVAVARKRSVMTAESWRVEVELGEPSPEGRAVDTEAVEQMFTGDLVPDHDKVWQETRFEEPVPHGVYATGCDWAQEIDHTVIWTWRCDVRPVRLVAYSRGNKRPYPWMIEQLMKRLKDYPGDAYHDELGVGKVAKDSFTEVVEPYHMIGMARNDLWLDYITAIERGEVTAPKMASAYNAHKYCRNIDLFASRRDVELASVGTGAKKPHPPDPFVAAALAWQAALMALNPVGLITTTGSRNPSGQPSGPNQTSGGGYLAGMLQRKE